MPIDVEAHQQPRRHGRHADARVPNRWRADQRPRPSRSRAPARSAGFRLHGVGAGSKVARPRRSRPVATSKGATSGRCNVVDKRDLEASSSSGPPASACAARRCQGRAGIGRRLCDRSRRRSTRRVSRSSVRRGSLSARGSGVGRPAQVHCDREAERAHAVQEGHAHVAAAARRQGGRQSPVVLYNTMSSIEHSHVSSELTLGTEEMGTRRKSSSSRPTHPVFQHPNMITKADFDR